MVVEFLEESLKVRQEQIESLKSEVNCLGMLLMFEKRSIFVRVKDYSIGSTLVRLVWKLNEQNGSFMFICFLVL